jgi:aubergine-like protein
VRGAWRDTTQQGKEIIDGLGRCMEDALKHYFKVNNFLPERVIIYRDGVGDGMLQLVVPISLCF